MIFDILAIVETVLILSVAALYIVGCPFNKVEESFNTQAIHDIINLFPTNSNHHEPTIIEYSSANFQEVAVRPKLPWDHTQFPGVVPRTFIGSLIVGLPMKIAKFFMFNGFISDETNLDDNSEPDFTSQFILQIGSRFTLACFAALSISAITKAVHRKYGLTFRLCFLILTISQFHYMFYIGRFLPNTFAAILANLVFASWINRQYSKSVIYIAICTIIFRFDTSLFFGWLLFDAIFIRRFLPLVKVLKIGIPAGLVAIAATFTIDSVFWSRPVWPELESLYFNIWLNKSHEWGTEPYFWYIYNCIPRIMLAGAPFMLLADHRITREYLIPSLAFIFTYSLLPHKELRFILFITPLLNICSASGLMNVSYYLNKFFLLFSASTQPKISSKNKKSDSKSSKNGEEKPHRSFIGTLFFVIVLLSLLVANLFCCTILSRVSSHNYPGGQAGISLGMTKELLDAAQKSLENNGIQDLRSDVAVYVDNLAAQTGLSRFLQVNGAYYSKSPKLDSDTFKKSYKLIYLILEPNEVVEFLKTHCPVDKNVQQLIGQGLEKWRRDNSEIKCHIPNQIQMYCSIIDTVNSFKSVNIGGLLRRLRSFHLDQADYQDGAFIKTRVALHTLRCSTKKRS